MPRLVGGEEGRPYNHIYITRKPRPVGGELHFSHAMDVFIYKFLLFHYAVLSVAKGKETQNALPPAARQSSTRLQWGQEDIFPGQSSRLVGA